MWIIHVQRHPAVNLWKFPHHHCQLLSLHTSGSKFVLRHCSNSTDPKKDIITDWLQVTAQLLSNSAPTLLRETWKLQWCLAIITKTLSRNIFVIIIFNFYKHHVLFFSYRSIWPTKTTELVKVWLDSSLSELKCPHVSIQTRPHKRFTPGKWGDGVRASE